MTPCHTYRIRDGPHPARRLPVSHAGEPAAGFVQPQCATETGRAGAPPRRAHGKSHRPPDEEPGPPPDPTPEPPMLNATLQVIADCTARTAEDLADVLREAGQDAAVEAAVSVIGVAAVLLRSARGQREAEQMVRGAMTLPAETVRLPEART